MSIQDARAQVGAGLGFHDFDGSVSAYGDLSQADQVRLNDALMGYIAANPSKFTDAQVAEAQKHIQNPAYNTPLADTSLSGQVGDFVTNYAADFESKVMKIIYIVAAVAAASYVLPLVLQRKK